MDQAYFMGDGNAVKVKFTLLEEAELHAAGPKISLEIMGKRYERDTAAPATGSIRLEKGDNTIAASCEKGTVSLVRL